MRLRTALASTLGMMTAVATIAGVILDAPSTVTAVDVLRGVFIATLLLGISGLGVLIVIRTGNVIGWGFCLMGLTLAWQMLSEARGDQRGLVEEWLGDALWWPSLLLIPAVILLFPTGSLPSRRWRWVWWVGGAGATAAMLRTLFAPTLFDRDVATPLAGVVSDEVLGALDLIGFPLLTVFVGAVLSAPFVRYRRAELDERLQLRWFAWGAVIALVGNIAFSVIWWDQAWADVSSAVTLMALPAAVTVAILKYRLYDIDVVISRTLVYGALAIFITVVYSGMVVGLGKVMSGDTESLTFQIAATAVVALAFEPVRDLAQRWANRLVYGRRATPYEVLSDLTERLSHAEQGKGILEQLANRLGGGTGAERATVWLGPPGSMILGASWPEDVPPEGKPELGAEHVFTVSHDDETVGALEVIKPKGITLSTAERALIANLAGSTGAVLGYRRLIDSLETKADELTRSRSRLVDAQVAERRRLERELHEGTQQHIVALKLKIGMARTMAAQRGAQDLGGLLAGLDAEAQKALDEVSALAKGIYPPVLESDGLGPAISALVAGIPGDVAVDCDQIGRYGRDVESAVYFDVSEAVTNAVKHGSEPIRVELVETGERLTFSVSDSGPGFDVASAENGSGLQNMRDRMDAIGGVLEVVSRSGEGTTIVGEISLQPSLV